MARDVARGRSQGKCKEKDGKKERDKEGPAWLEG